MNAHTAASTASCLSFHLDRKCWEWRSWCGPGATVACWAAAQCCVAWVYISIASMYLPVESALLANRSCSLVGFWPSKSLRLPPRGHQSAVASVAIACLSLLRLPWVDSPFSQHRFTVHRPPVELGQEIHAEQVSLYAYKFSSKSGHRQVFLWCRRGKSVFCLDDTLL